MVKESKAPENKEREYPETRGLWWFCAWLLLSCHSYSSLVNIPLQSMKLSSNWSKTKQLPLFLCWKWNSYSHSICFWLSFNPNPKPVRSLYISIKLSTWIQLPSIFADYFIILLPSLLNLKTKQASMKQIKQLLTKGESIENHDQLKKHW